MKVRAAGGRPANRAIPWVAGAALVVAAGAVTAFTPSTDALLEPIQVQGSLDETVQARTLTATVIGLSFADRVTTTASEWEAEGNWLVIELTASAPTTEVDAAIGVASLVIDGQLFQASERPPSSLVGTKLRVGTDTVGVLAFELPDDLRSGTGELRLAGGFPTPQLDDVISLPLALDAIPAVSAIDIEEPRLGKP